MSDAEIDSVKLSGPVFYPNHERLVAKYVAQEMGLTVSFEEEKEEIRCIFLDKSTGIKFITSNGVDALMKSLSRVGNEGTLQMLFNPESLEGKIIIGMNYHMSWTEPV